MEVLSPVVAANLHCLEQAIELLGRLPESAFVRTGSAMPGPWARTCAMSSTTTAPSSPACPASASTTMPARAGPRLESDPRLAVARMREILGELVLVEEELLDLPIQIRLESGGAESEQWSHSTVRRELQFLLSHTVHHFALIGMLLERFEIAVPEDFGIAPSTLKFWQAQASCAPLPG